MGRQAFLTRFALGRSPFEEPELTESGEFILGSHAHDLDNRTDGYVQQFNDKGHPVNPAAKAAAKEFRRAKNDVLKTIGVVQEKENGEIKRRKTTEKEIVATLFRENAYGPWLKAMNSGLTLLSLWWLMSLRSRFQTFRSFSSLPLLEIIKSEIRLLGPLTFFTSGLLAWFVTMPVTFCRQIFVEITADSIIQKATSREDHTVSRQRYAARMNVLCQVLDFALFSIAAPVLMFSDLQMLHLIQPMARPSPRSLIPFTSDSPIRTPPFSGPLSMPTLLQTGFEVCRSPILIFWLYDCARHAVETVIYRIVCATVPRPDLPDKLSELAARKGDENEDTIPGLRLEDGPTLRQQIQYEAENFLDWFRGWKFWETGKLIHRSSEESIRLKFIAIEREILFGPTTAHRSRPSEAMGYEIRRHAARLAWESQGRTPPDDLDAWISRQPGLQTNSTSTPQLEELFVNAEAEAEAIGEVANNPLPPRELGVDSSLVEFRQPDNQHEGLPAEPILEDTSRHSSTIHILYDPSFPSGNNDTFWQSFLHSYTANVITSSGQLQMWQNPDLDGTPPPVRRAPMLTSDSSSRSFSRSRSRSRHREHSDSRAWLPRHRVTSLSNYPADALAYHMSMALTTVVMLPLESLYLRALARAFLASPAARPGAVAAATGIGADVRSLTAWFGGEGGWAGRARYCTVMLLISGMQAIISAGVWGVGTRVAVWMGKSACGWGKRRAWETTGGL